MVDLTKFKKKQQRLNLDYPNIPSSMSPTAHDESLPIPKPPKDSSSKSDMSDDECNEEYMLTDDANSKIPHILNQDELDDSVRDLELTKSHSELLESRLQVLCHVRTNFLL